jgi:hypothetical protein
MSDVTRILSAIEQGDPKAAEQLLPLVYDELRKLAANKLARLASLQPETLQSLRPLLRDGSARVRAQACHLLGKHHVIAATAEIKAILQFDLLLDRNPRQDR